MTLLLYLNALKGLQYLLLEQQDTFLLRIPSTVNSEFVKEYFWNNIFGGQSYFLLKTD